MLLLLVFLLVSCGTGGLSDIPLEPLGDPTEGEIPDRYEVITASDCSAEERALAQSLAEAIETRTGILAKVLYQHEADLRHDGVFVIYLGWNGKAEAVSGAMRSLRSRDYLCRREGDTLILGGPTDEATASAVDRFCREILPAATAECLMSESGGFLYRAEDYGVGTVRFNGFELWEYRIVYPAEGEQGLLTLAYALREEIAKRSGYVLEVCPDGELDGATKGIFVGTEPPSQEGASAYLLPKSNGVLLSAEDLFGVSVAAECLCAKLLEGSPNTDRAWSLTTAEAFVYNRQSYELISMAVREENAVSSPQQITAMTDPVLIRRPNGVLYGTVGDRAETYLTQSLPSYTRMSEAGAECAYSKDGAMTWQASHATGVQGITATSFWVGDDWNGFRVLRISGTPAEGQSLSWTQLSAWLTEEPTVILIHTADRGLTVTGGPPQTLRAILSEQITVGGETGVFSCYASARNLTVRVENGGEAALYRSITVERASAF